jgi:hypothetical protein
MAHGDNRPHLARDSHFTDTLDGLCDFENSPWLDRWRTIFEVNSTPPTLPLIGAASYRPER